MRLIGVRIDGVGRLQGVDFRVDRKLTAIVGPNEAGKSTILKALRNLNDSDPITARERSRNVSVPDSQVVVEADFVIEAADLRLLADLPLSTKPRTYTRLKKADGSRQRSIEPKPTFEEKLWRHAVAGVKVLLAMVEEASFEAGSSEETDRVSSLALLQSLLDFLESRSGEFGPSSFDELLTVLARMAPGVAVTAEHLESLDAKTRFLVENPDAEEAVASILIPRIPRFELFSESDRSLLAEYPVESLDPTAPPSALKNLLSLAGVSLAQILPNASNRTPVASSRDEANDVLDHVFQNAWKQHRIAVKIEFDADQLVVFVKDLGPNGKTIAFDERSDGLKLFVALTAFLSTRDGEVPPILLIDEAETRLHWDAQADLVNVLSTASDVGQIIYTTHSPGCLPQDLGTGVLFVQPSDNDPNRSNVRQDFWNAAKGQLFGFAPMLFMMGAGAAAFSKLRRAVVAEGPSDMLLLPTLLRAGNRLQELDYQVAPGISITAKSQLRELDQTAVNVAYLVDGDKGGRDWKTQLIESGVDEERVVELSAGVAVEDLFEPEFYVSAYLAAAKRSESFSELKLGRGPVKTALEKLAKDVWEVDPPSTVEIADAILAEIERSAPGAPDYQRVKLAPGAATELKRIHAAFMKLLKGTEAR